MSNEWLREVTLVSAQRGYRLDYHGDDIPEYLTAREARLLVEIAYPAGEALKRLEEGLPVLIEAGYVMRRANLTG